MSQFLMRPKHFAKAVLRRVRTFIYKYPKIQQLALAAITRLGLYDIAHKTNARLTSAKYRSFVPQSIEHLTPRARHIYDELKAAIDKNRAKR